MAGILTPIADLAYGVTETTQNAVAATGNGTAIDARGATQITVAVTGTFTAVVTFEGSIDGGVTFFPIALLKSADGTYALNAAAAGTFILPTQGPDLSDFRTPVAWTSGTSVTVKTRKAAH
jgi:hypothetical protein